MYTVWVNALPGFKLPTLIVVQVCVQAASEYTPTFTEVIVPSKVTFREALSAARVTSVVNTTAIEITIIASFENFLVIILTLKI